MSNQTIHARLIKCLGVSLDLERAIEKACWAHIYASLPAGSDAGSDADSDASLSTNSTAIDVVDQIYASEKYIAAVKRRNCAIAELDLDNIFIRAKISNGTDPLAHLTSTHTEIEQASADIVDAVKQPTWAGHDDLSDFFGKWLASSDGRMKACIDKLAEVFPPTKVSTAADVDNVVFATRAGPSEEANWFMEVLEERYPIYFL